MYSTETKSLVKRSFGFPLKLLQFLGYYPPAEFTVRYRIYSYTVYSLCMVPATFLAAVNLFTGDISLDKVSENAFTIFQLGGFIIKLWPFLNKSATLKKSIFMIESQFFTSYTKRQEIIIDECVRVCNRNCSLFMISCLCAFITWVGAPLLGAEWKLPMDIWLPMNFKDTPGIFCAVYIILAIGVFYACNANAVLDLLLSGLLYHVSSQFKILKDNLQNLDKDDRKENINDCEEGKNAIIYHKITKCVVHHNAILRFLEEFEELYSSFFFIQLLVSIVVICICCLQLSMVEPFSVQFFSMISFLSTMLAEIYLYCYYGTVLFEESNCVMDAAYFGNWYDYDLKSRKALLIFMERSKKPVIVTAGKILNLSLDTFTTILRKAYSLLAVLKNM